MLDSFSQGNVFAIILTIILTVMWLGKKKGGEREVTVSFSRSVIHLLGFVAVCSVPFFFFCFCFCF